MELIGNGAQAEIFKDNDIVIKLFKKNISKDDIEYEMNLQKMAYEHGLSVPKIYEIVEINGKYGIKMEYINGVTFGKIILDDMNKLNEYLSKSIEIQIGIHKIVTNNLPSMKEKLKSKINRVQLITENEKQNIIKLLDKEKFNNNLCHGDFQFMNILETENGNKVIDWVDSSSGNIEADVYRTYLLYKVNNDEIAELYINNYCKMADISKENVLKWAPVIASARLSEGMGNDENEKLLNIVRNNI